MNRSAARALGLAAGILVLVLVGRRFVDDWSHVLRGVESLGPWAAAAFVGLYAALTVAWVPGSVMTLAAGAIFGLVEGTLVALTGATIGAALAFLVARYVARDAVEGRLRGHRKLRMIDAALAQEGAKVVFLLRLSPVFPFNALNYALGLTRVRFRDYVLASATGMVPGAFLYVYAGHAAGRVADAAIAETPRGAGYYALLAVGLVATIAATVLLTRAARRQLERDANLAGESG